MKAKNETVTSVQSKRKSLSHLSKVAKEHIKEKLDASKTEDERQFWNSIRVNDVLLMWYKEQTGATELKTFMQWKNEGYSVKKGEKAFTLWSKKRKVSKNEENYEFFPLTYMFSNLQVEKIESKQKISEVYISYKNKNKNMPQIVCSSDSAEILKPCFNSFIEHHEETWALLLNRSNKCLGATKISQGGISSAIFDTRILLQAAIKTNASGVIMAHNHPSGSPMPSQEDKNLTEKVSNACKLLEIPLLDHVILTSDSYFSFADEYMLN